MTTTTDLRTAYRAAILADEAARTVTERRAARRRQAAIEETAAALGIDLDAAEGE